MKAAGFDWDSANSEKCEKHGVTREEIEELFRGRVYVAPDPKHSSDEERYLAIGRGTDGRPMFVAFALRRSGTETFIRPISARYMHKKEARRYEEAFAEDEE